MMLLCLNWLRDPLFAKISQLSLQSSCEPSIEHMKRKKALSCTAVQVNIPHAKGSAFPGCGVFAYPRLCSGWCAHGGLRLSRVCMRVYTYGCAYGLTFGCRRGILGSLHNPSQYSILVVELNKIQKCCSTWQTSLNVENCKLLTFSRGSSKQHFH